MAKRSVTDEVQIAALSAAVELIKNPEYSRDWLKTEFADREINSVRVTNDILDAVEVTMVNQLDQIAAVLKLQLEALIERAETDESDEKPEFAGGDIPVVDFIGNLHDDSKTSETSGIFPAGSKIARAEAAANAKAEQEFSDHLYAKSRELVARAIEVITDEERSKGNEVSEAEASAILQKRLSDDLQETD